MHRGQRRNRLLPMLRPPLFSLHVGVVPKLNSTLFLVRPLIRIVAVRVPVGLYDHARGNTRTRLPYRRRAPYPSSHVLVLLAQRQLHRFSHLSISLLLFGTIREMEDMLIQPGRGLCGRRAVVTDRFIGT